MKYNFFIAVMVLMLFGACSGNADLTAAPAHEPGTITISFDYTKQSGFGTNQFAVWIENEAEDFVKTLYATKFTANGGYIKRPDSLSIWVAKSGLADVVTTAPDAAAGATPKAGSLNYIWDLTDVNGNKVENGTYYYKVEASTRGKNRTLHTGEAVVGAQSFNSEATIELILEESPGYPILAEDAVENKMISGVKAVFVPS